MAIARGLFWLALKVCLVFMLGSSLLARLPAEAAGPVAIALWVVIAVLCYVDVRRMRGAKAGSPGEQSASR